ncbi:ribonuclease P protein component [Mariniblastus fucicola]|uniref:ribonuclease P protein component n=1 Tax=Mariniblastus fucicola TaxID=980251 RepID=UPI000946200D|nr:ribonuclease P protein component [Mariniblastus fucicola]
MASRLSYTKAQRLLSRQDFDRVYQRDHFAADDVLVIRATRRHSPADQSRLGLAVSKKVGNAVVRNRWKRRIREAFRGQQHELPAGMDIVVRPRKGAVCDYHAIAISLSKLMQRLDRKMPPAEQP